MCHLRSGEDKACSTALRLLKAEIPDPDVVCFNTIIFAALKLRDIDAVHPTPADRLTPARPRARAHIEMAIPDQNPPHPFPHSLWSLSERWSSTEWSPTTIPARHSSLQVRREVEWNSVWKSRENVYKFSLNYSAGASAAMLKIGGILGSFSDKFKSRLSDAIFT